MGAIVFDELAGLGLAAAVLVDATIVRMVLVPSTMELLGRCRAAEPPVRPRPPRAPGRRAAPAGRKGRAIVQP